MVLNRRLARRTFWLWLRCRLWLLRLPCIVGCAACLHHRVVATTRWLIWANAFADHLFVLHSSELTVWVGGFSLNFGLAVRCCFAALYTIVIDLCEWSLLPMDSFPEDSPRCLTQLLPSTAINTRARRWLAISAQRIADPVVVTAVCTRHRRRRVLDFPTHTWQANRRQLCGQDGS